MRSPHRTKTEVTNSPDFLVAAAHLLAWASSKRERVWPREIMREFGVSRATANRWASSMNDALTMYRVERRDSA